MTLFQRQSLSDKKVAEPVTAQMRSGYRLEQRGINTGTGKPSLCVLRVIISQNFCNLVGVKTPPA